MTALSFYGSRPDRTRRESTVKNDLFNRIKVYIETNGKALPFAVASRNLIESAETVFGFSLPPLLRECYLEIGNGGFGPGLGLIGVEGGYASDFGDIVARTDNSGPTIAKQAAYGGETCSRFASGDAIYSLASGAIRPSQIHTLADFNLWPQDYSLDGFFEMWMSGIDILSHNHTPGEVDVEFINPFTGRKETLKKRRG